MREVLQRLNLLSGMKGSLVVTPDGLPIAAELLEDMDRETAAGLSAFIGRMLNDWAGEVQAGKISIGLMEAKEARLFFAPVDWGYLVAITEKHCPLGEMRLEMKVAVAGLNEVCARLATSLQKEEAQVV
jgi:predicted regulator of Ras-like GTPase activity (Roadblock/LC7/MglB family)